MHIPGPPDCDHLLLTEPHSVLSMAEQAEVVAFAHADPRNAILGRTLWMEFFPLPAWVKMFTNEKKLKMLRINAAFEEDVGILAKDYVDHADDEVWDEESTASFQEGDLRVLQLRRACKGIEITNLPDGSAVSWRVWKWPMFGRSGHAEDEIIAICGFGERK